MVIFRRISLVNSIRNQTPLSLQIHLFYHNPPTIDITPLIQLEKGKGKAYNIFMKTIYQGTISCKAILEEKKRKIAALYVDPKKRTKDFAYILHLAKKAEIPVYKRDREELDILAQSKTHGGMLLEAEPREIPNLTHMEAKQGLIFYVEGLEDPYNLGSVARTLYAAGANLLILPKRDWENAASIILKASAGAFEKLCIAYADEKECIAYLKKNHIPLICAYRKEAEPLSTFLFPKTCCIAVGGAYRGLSQKIIQACDKSVYIQYGRDFRNALDTSSAVAVLAFDYLNKELIQHENQ